MSGSFEDLDVPPTLISFAVAVGNMKRATSLNSRTPITVSYASRRATWPTV